MADACLRPPFGDGATEAHPAQRHALPGVGRAPWINGVVERARTGTSLRAVNVPPASSSRCARCSLGDCSTSTRGARVVKATASDDRRRAGGARRDYEHDRENFAEASDHLGRTMLTLSAFALLPAIAAMFVIWLSSDGNAHRLRPRVRAGAALGRNAGHRAAFASSGHVSRITRVHGHALRSHPAGYYVAKPVTTEKTTWAGLRRNRSRISSSPWAMRRWSSPRGRSL